ncbi:hypothetical protein [Labrys sp. 22185]|uniref:hypothetical protein n=1 Tax=Labrys sp. 22185 TaxID=3453888 RepID=UPI003F867D1E
MTQEVQAGSSGTGLSFCADLRVRGRGRAIGFADRRDGGSSSPVSAAFPGADETSAPPADASLLLNPSPRLSICAAAFPPPSPKTIIKQE